MKYAFLLSILLLSACQKEAEPNLEDKIRGTWQQTFSPHSIYWFCDGMATQRVIAAGDKVYRNDFTYTADADTLFLTDVVENTVQRWIVSFPTDSTARVSIEAGFVIWLKRFQ